MKILRLAVIGSFLYLCQLAQAAENPKFVSRTFQDILSRVVSRDKETGAIETVQRKDDERLIMAGGPHFSLEETSNPLRGKEAVVTLSTSDMTGTIVYEQYRLRIDNAIAQELLRQKQLAENKAKQQQKLEAEQKRRQEEQTQKIEQLTGGVLKFGMSREAIEAIKGKPTSMEVSPLNHLIQSGSVHHYYFTLTYPDMELNFDGGLYDVKVTNAQSNTLAPLPPTLSIPSPTVPAASPSSSAT